MIAEAIRAVLVADVTLTAQLATYDSGAGDEPAVFAFEPAPRNCANPVIVVVQDGYAGEFGTREHRGALARATVKVWGDKGHSDAALSALAWRVWSVLDRAHLTLVGFEEVGVFAQTPGRTEDDDGFPGYILPVDVRILEE